MTHADGGTIADFLDDLGQIGVDAGGGYSRMAFGDAEREAHALFKSRLEDYGLKTYTDVIGNSYGILPGKEELPALMTGSHLDTVYSGGNFDGAVGVAAAVEMARIFASDEQLTRPLKVVAFAGEEGARFGAPCMGSRLVTGAYTDETMRTLVDRDGITAFDAATNVGLKPQEASSARWNFADVACFVEIHIEQGRVLEARERQIGIVHSIGGSTRVELVFRGRADHSGATPMWLRKDALVAASEFVIMVENRAKAHATTVATVGRLDVSPNSMTTVPGSVLIQLDVRDIDSERQRDLAEDLLDDAIRIGSGRGIQVAARSLSDQSPVVLHGTVQAVLSEATQRQGIPFLSMSSGASHDAAHIAKHAPTGMVFIPCREGISHSPEEQAEPDHIATAVDVVMDAFRAVDAGARV
jgi:allantoate deiminase